MGAMQISSAMLADNSAFQFNVKAFGAKGNGVADDTAAIQATINAAKAAGGGCVFLPDGIYRTTAPLVADFSKFSMRGSSMWSSTIVTNQQIDILRFDFTNTFLNFMEVTNLGFLYDGVSAPTAGSAIRNYNSSANPLFGGSHHSYRNLMIRATYLGMVFDKAHLGVWLGIPSIADYGHLMFDNIHIPYNNDFTEIGILFRGGPGAHNTFRGGSMQVKTVGIRMGDNTENCGVGDQLLEGLHILNGDYAIDIFGPTGVDRYNENITISGCQFDGISTSTVRMTNMMNFRIENCNSTNEATYDLNTCTGYSIEQTGEQESRYIKKKQTLASGATSVVLFDVDLSKSSDEYCSAYVELFVDAFVGGVGTRPVLWRGFVRYQGIGSISFHAAENYVAGLTGVAVSPSVVGSVVRFAVSITGSTSAGLIDAQMRVVGRNARVVTQ